MNLRSRGVGDGPDEPEKVNSIVVGAELRRSVQQAPRMRYGPMETAARSPSPASMLIRLRSRYGAIILLIGLIAYLALAPQVAAQSAGTIVISNDEWVLSDSGFSANTTRFVQNLTTLFGGSGNVLGYSENFGLTSNSLAVAMRTAGNTYTVNTNVSFTLANLLAYKAVFLAGPVRGSVPDTTVLTQYVRSGGNVLILGGTGAFGDTVDESAAWSPFLGTFGLQFASAYSIGCATDGIISSDPLFAGVGALYFCGGQETLVVNTGNPNTRVVATDANGFKLFAVSINLICTDQKITLVLPNHGGNAGSATAQVNGCGFQAGLSAKLTGIASDILGANTTVANQFSFNTTFNLTGATAGLRNVVVTNPDNTTTTLTGGFTVEQGGAPQVWVDIVGRDKIRIGSAQTFYISYGNRGNLDAPAAHIWLSFPTALQWKVASGQQPTATQVLKNGDILIVFDILPVPAGSTGAIPLVLQTPTTFTSPFQLRAWSNQ